MPTQLGAYMQEARARALREGTLGAHVRAARERVGLSQGALATAVGVRRFHIVKIETGQIVNPGVQIMASIARVLGTTVDALLWREPPTDGR